MFSFVPRSQFCVKQWQVDAPTDRTIQMFIWLNGIKWAKKQHKRHVEQNVFCFSFTEKRQREKALASCSATQCIQWCNRERQRSNFNFCAHFVYIDVQNKSYPIMLLHFLFFILPKNWKVNGIGFHAIDPSIVGF